MSETKFTPGPWRFEVDGDTNYAKIFCSSNPHDGDNLRGYCGKHNAHLIAAAPELYEALQRLITSGLDPYTHNMIMSDPSHYVNLALAKARGEG